MTQAEAQQICPELKNIVWLLRCFNAWRCGYEHHEIPGYVFTDMIDLTCELIEQYDRLKNGSADPLTL
jgi:hypothetical protein